MKMRRAAMMALAAFVLGLAAATVPASAESPIPVPSPRPAYAPKATAKAATNPAKPATSVAIPKPPAGGYKNGRVIILRGLHNVWSRGMDALAKKFEAQGVTVTLANHSHWQRLANEAIEDYKKDKNVAPIIIIGHSLGGDAALVMSNWIVHNGVPVRFVVVFDAVAQTHPVEPGVAEVLNFYKPKGYGQEVTGSKRYKGEIINIDLTQRKDVDHLNIDEDEELQDDVLARSLAILQGQKTASR